MSASTAIDLRDLEKDPRLFLYTSLTAGSSHIITATSRLETILKANKIPFQAIDMATDEKARRLWQRRAGSRKLPGLVKEGYVLGDLAEVEEWNEFGELKENIGPVPTNNAAPVGGQLGVNIAPPSQFAPMPASSAPRPANAPTPASSTGVSGQTAVPAAKLPESGFDRTKGIALPLAAEVAARAQAMKKSQNEAGSASASVAEATSPPAAESATSSASTPVTRPKRATSISFAPDTNPPKTVSPVSPAAAAAADHVIDKPSPTSTPSAANPTVTTDSSTLESTTSASSATPTAIPASVTGSDALAAPTTHQGKEVRSASEEQVREVEQANALKEDPREEDEEHAESKNNDAGVKSVEKNVEKLSVVDDAKTEDVAAKSDMKEEKEANVSDAAAKKEETSDSSESVTKTQEQDPKDEEKATASVQD